MLARIVRAVVVALSVVFVLAAGLLLFLMSGPGERWIAGKVTDRVDQAIAGSISIGELEFGLDRFVLRDVVIETADGAEVIWAERIMIDLSLSEILGGNIALDRLAVSEYGVVLEKRAGQWTLVEALEPTTPGGAKRPIAIHALDLHDGTVTVGSDGKTEAVIRDLSVTGSLARRELWDATLVAEGHTDANGSKRVSARIRARGSDGVQRLSTTASYGSSRLQLDAAIPNWTEGDAPSLADLTVQVDLRIQSFTHGGWTYGPAYVEASLVDGELAVPRARVQLPGAQLERAPPRSGSAAVRLEVESLSATLQSLADLTGRSLPAGSGKGTLAVRLDHSLSSAEVKVDGSFERLAIGGTAVRGLQIDARVEDISRLKEGEIAIEADRLTIGERKLRGVELQLRRRDRQFALDARVGRPYRASLSAEAVVFEQDDWLARIEELTLSYPRTTWTVKDSAFLDIEPSGVAIEGLVLESGAQRIALRDASWTPSATSADLQVTGLELSQLPQGLLPQTPMAGQLQGRVQLSTSGDSQDLRGSVDMTATDWRIGRIRGQRTQLDATMRDGRATGSLNVRLYGGSVSGTFDVPAGLPPSKEAPIQADLEISDVRLRPVWRDAMPRLPQTMRERIGNVSGRLHGSLQLAGTAERPRPSGRIRLEGAKANVRALKGCCQFDLVARVTPQKIIIDELVARAQSGRVRIEGWARQLSDGRYRYRLTAHARKFPVPGKELRASGELTVRGKASAEQVQANVSFDDIHLTAPSAPLLPRRLRGAR